MMDDAKADCRRDSTEREKTANPSLDGDGTLPMVAYLLFVAEDVASHENDARQLTEAAELITAYDEALLELASAVATTAMPEAARDRLFPVCMKAKAVLDNARRECSQ